MTTADTSTSPRAELAAAIRRINVIYRHAGEPDIRLSTDTKRIEREIDAAIARDDGEAAGEAVRAWEAEVRAEIERAER